MYTIIKAFVKRVSIIGSLVTDRFNVRTSSRIRPITGTAAIKQVALPVWQLWPAGRI